MAVTCLPGGIVVRMRQAKEVTGREGWCGFVGLKACETLEISQEEYKITNMEVHTQ